MSYTIEARQHAKEIRNRLRKPPNAVVDRPICLTRISTAIKGENIPTITPRVVIEEPVLKCRVVIEEVVVEPPPKPPKQITFKRILEEVARYHLVSKELIMSKSRLARIVRLRHIVVVLSMRLCPSRSMASIGREFLQDHTTIISARDKMARLIETYPELKSRIDHIESIIRYGNIDKPPVAAFNQQNMAERREEGLSQ